MKTTFLTAENQFAEIGGNKIAYRAFGEGEHLLLYNRFRGVMDTWDPVFLDLLATAHRVVLFDYPGIGDSEGELPTQINLVAQAGISLMDHLGVNKFFIGGWSYGGQVAQVAMFEHQARILKTVLIGTNPPGDNKVPFDKAFFERALKPVNDLEDEYILFFEPASDYSKDAAYASHQRIEQRLDPRKIPADQEVLKRYLAGSALVREDKQDYRGAYQNLRIPVLVISGDHDISFAVENWFPLLRHAPSMQHIIMNDSGHAPHHQRPHQSAGYINQFLSSAE